VQQQKPWWDWTDEELATEAQASMRGQGALVESMRRLRASTEIHSWWLAFFTVVLAVLTIVLAGFTFVLALAAAHELHWIS
jgi:hypothetical protein